VEAGSDRAFVPGCSRNPVLNLHFGIPVAKLARCRPTRCVPRDRSFGKHNSCRNCDGGVDVFRGCGQP
jgi:hypothetical protein